METITVTINGKKAEAQKGLTILEVARENGVKIPTLCHSDVLEPTASCRICVVEVAGAKALLPACAVKADNGMVIETHTDKVVRARRVFLELLWADHPNDCTMCDKSGACELQELSYEYGVDINKYKKSQHYEPKFKILGANNPYYTRDYNKCVLCGRCINACAEIQGNNVIDFSYRGSQSSVSTAFGKPLMDSNCVFCGNCIALCPTGALTEKERIGKGREWEFKRVKTTCPYCGCGCTFDLCVKDNKVVRSDTSDPSGNVVNKTALCVKGRFGMGFINSADRLNFPMIRKTPKSAEKPTLAGYEVVSWEKALSYTAERLSAIKKEHGADSLGGFSSARCTNEENYIFMKFIRAALGTNNVDHCARLCHASTVAGLAKSFGSGAMTNSISELRDAECILITGSNTTETHPIISLEIKKAVKNGCKLIIIEPRNIELCSIATLSLHQKPGTDVAWINGMMNVILAEGLENKEFIAERCENFDAVKEIVANYTPEKVEEITGIPADELRKAARIYATSKTSSIIYSMGITQHTCGTENVLSVANLAMITGQIGRPSTGVNPLRGQNNVQGACDMGALPNVFSGYQAVTDPANREKFEKAWNVSNLPDKIGLTVTEMVNAAHDGKLKALYIMGENPMVADPDLNHAEEAIRKLDFLVVQDIFPTETALLADVILPAASFAEKTGTFTNTERRVQLVRQAVTPEHERRQDYDIVCELSSRLGHSMNYSSQKEIMDEIASVTPSYGGISFERIENEGGLQWPCPNAGHPGTPYLHNGKFTRGKGLFTAVEFRAPAEQTDKDYPIILTTGRILEHYHTGSMTRRAEPLNAHIPHGWVEISPSLAAKLCVADGEKVRVSSRRGQIEITAKVTDKVIGDVVFIPFHFIEAAANKLTIAALDPIASIPEFKVCAVAVSKL